MANKTINGKQCTIIWHVGDLNILHVDKSVIEDIIIIKRKIWKRKSTYYSPRKINGIPGYDTRLYHNGQGKNISVQIYLKMLTELPLDMNGSANPRWHICSM